MGSVMFIVQLYISEMSVNDICQDVGIGLAVFPLFLDLVPYLVLKVTRHDRQRTSN